MERIVEHLKQQQKAMALFDLADALNLPPDELQTLLAQLVNDGQLILTKKKKYVLPEDAGLVPARAVSLRSGKWMAKPTSGDPDMVIRSLGALHPMHGDQILVRPLSRHAVTGCQLLHISKRAHQRFVAVLSSPREATPTDARIAPSVLVEGNLCGAQPGDLVLLNVTRWPSSTQSLTASVERSMGSADDIHAQLLAIVAKHDLPDQFPPEALAQAESVPTEVLLSDLEDRLDLRGTELFTIDGDDAQDFDDAVSLEQTPDGLLLGVHIADVSHYVPKHTPIDREATRRGTSVYLPGLTLPMLPESLCNHICSLMPRVDRLAMSLLMTIRDAKVVDVKLAPSVIHSRARLTYAQVNLLFAGEETNVPESLHDTLRAMLALSHQLRATRHQRGSIDFDMPEAAFTLNKDGIPIDIFARERGESERLIEDFMLLANETVAQWARAAELPFLYRSHAHPDAERVRALEIFLVGLGINAKLSPNPAPGKFQKLLEDSQGKPEARLIKQIMLKSLRRAEYTATPDGHFGLAARDYCHFTSPIRRYPDLTIHRMLKLMLKGFPFAHEEKHMPELAQACSTCEQRATLAERDADDLLKAHYMSSRIGESFVGIVTSVTAWGFYVTLDNTVEGFVPMRSLPGYYQLDEPHHALIAQGRKSIRLGDTVPVLVERVNLSLAQIDFVMILN